MNSNGEHFINALYINPSLSPQNREEQELYQALLSSEILLKDTKNESIKCGIRSAYLHVTQRCNLHCLGCYSYNSSRAYAKDASTANMKTAILHLSQAGVSNLIISGGEPFLRTDLSQLLAYARSIGIQEIDIITNGTVLTRQKILEVKPYVNTIAVSIDGFSKDNDCFIRDKGIFDKVTETIQLIRANGVDVSVLPTIHCRNYKYLHEYTCYANNLNAKISFSLLTYPPYSKECNHSEDTVYKKRQSQSLSDFLFNTHQLKELASMLIHSPNKEQIQVLDSTASMNLSCNMSCGVCSKLCSIGYDGSVYPCHMLHYKQLVLGNIFTQNLEEIMSSQIAQQIKNINVEQINTCRNCEYRYVCGGGCRARSYFQHEDFKSCDSYCPMNKEYFRQVAATLESLFITQKSHHTDHQPAN